MQMHLTPLSAPILAPPPDSVNANEYISVFRCRRARNTFSVLSRFCFLRLRRHTTMTGWVEGSGTIKIDLQSRLSEILT